MNKNLSVLTILLVISGCALFSSTAKEPETEISGKSFLPDFSWDTVPVFAQMAKPEGDFTEEEARFLAEHFQIIAIEKTQGMKVPGAKVEDAMYRAVRQLKAINPETKVLFYFNISINFPWYRASETFRANPDWAMRDKDGNFVTWHPDKKKSYDLSNPDVREWWSDVCAKAVAEAPFDGITADAFPKAVALEKNKRATWGDEKYEAVRDGLIQTIELTKKKMGPDKMFAFNGLFANPDWWSHGGVEYLKYADGVMVEHFTIASARDSQGKLKLDKMMREIENIAKASAMGKVVMVKTFAGDLTWLSAREKYKDLSQEDKLKMMREEITFPLAAFLVAAQKYCYFGYSWGYTLDTGWLQWYPELDKPLGPPKGPAKRDGWIYTREFEHASVWVDLENEKGKIDWH